jgi:hypothetical protein
MSLSHIPSERSRMLRYLFDMCSGICFYCRRVCDEPDNRGKYNPASATIDHVQPQSRGGSGHVSNLVLSCADCNNIKGSLNKAEFYAAKMWGVDFERYARYTYPLPSVKSPGVIMYERNRARVLNEINGVLSGDKMLSPKKRFKNKEKLRAKLQLVLNALPGDINVLKKDDKERYFAMLDRIENLTTYKARVPPSIGESGQFD